MRKEQGVGNRKCSLGFIPANRGKLWFNITYKPVHCLNTALLSTRKTRIKCEGYSRSYVWDKQQQCLTMINVDDLKIIYEISLHIIFSWLPNNDIPSRSSQHRLLVRLCWAEFLFMISSAQDCQQFVLTMKHLRWPLHQQSTYCSPNGYQAPDISKLLCIVSKSLQINKRNRNKIWTKKLICPE